MSFFNSMFHSVSLLKIVHNDESETFLTSTFINQIVQGMSPWKARCSGRQLNAYHIKVCRTALWCLFPLSMRGSFVIASTQIYCTQTGTASISKCYSRTAAVQISAIIYPDLRILGYFRVQFWVTAHDLHQWFHHMWWINRPVRT